MHDIAGIEVGTSRHSLPPQISYTPSTAIPNSIGNNLDYQLMSSNVLQNSKKNLLKTKHGKMSPMPLFQDLSLEQINRMPTEAVVVLDRIHHKLERYLDWQQAQQSQSQSTQTTAVPLSERRFVLDKLISQTIPEAVNQYDQLARFNPHQLSQKIHDNMTAGDMLIAVLLGVDKQTDELLHELNQQVSSQLATTYHYVKSRINQ